jgi:hypothetical protein
MTNVTVKGKKIVVEIDISDATPTESTSGKSMMLEHFDQMVVVDGKNTRVSGNVYLPIKKNKIA